MKISTVRGLLETTGPVFGGLVLALVGAAVPASVRAGGLWLGGPLVATGVLLLALGVLGTLARSVRETANEVRHGYVEVTDDRHGR